MPTIMERLEKLTKAELIEVFVGRPGLGLTDREILMARYNVLNNRADRVTNEGLAAMKKWSARSGVKARIEWLKASAVTDRGLEMYAKASKLLEGGIAIDKD